MHHAFLIPGHPNLSCKPMTFELGTMHRPPMRTLLMMHTYQVLCPYKRINTNIN